MTFFSYLIIGLLGGAIAKAILPGKQGGGFVKTMFLGIVGAFIGGFLGNTLFHVTVTYDRIFSLRGLLFSVLGSLLLLVVYGFISKNRS